MPTVLITGSNRGIGLALARTYAAEGWRVVAACRSPERSTALRALDGTVDLLPLDVADESAIADCARHLNDVPIDVLIHNAGLFNPKPGDLQTIDRIGWEQSFRVNVMAPVFLSRSLLTNLERSDRKVIAAVSSTLGSIAENTSGGMYAYRSTKAALNMAMRSLAHDVKSRGITVVSLHPGWVRTDMGGAGAPLSPSDSASGLKSVIGRLSLAESGQFFDYRGRELPW